MNETSTGVFPGVDPNGTPFSDTTAAAPWEMPTVDGALAPAAAGAASTPAIKANPATAAAAFATLRRTQRDWRTLDESAYDVPSSGNGIPPFTASRATITQELRRMAIK